MSYLTIRAEQALIGAMLADRQLPPEMDYLRPSDLGHRVYQQVFATIVDVRSDDASISGDLLAAVVAERVAVPGVEASWLSELRDKCPEPAHIAAYARMIQVGAFRRDIAAHGERIAASATTGRANTETAENMVKLAQALTRQAQIFTAYTFVDDADPLRASVNGSSTASMLESRERREDQILADLLQHPEQAGDLARALHSDVFTSSQRREIFETMVMLAEAGDPIDEIIVLWTLESQRGFATMFGDRLQWTESTAEPDAAYLARLAGMTVAIGTAAQVGRELVAADIRQQLTQAAETVSVPQRPSAAALDPSLIPPTAMQPGISPRLEL